MPSSNVFSDKNANFGADFDALIPASFDSAAINAIAAAYHAAIRELGLRGRIDPITEIVARKIIGVAEAGERDPARLQARAVFGLGLAEIPVASLIEPMS